MGELFMNKKLKVRDVNLPKVTTRGQSYDSNTYQNSINGVLNKLIAFFKWIICRTLSCNILKDML